jgi:hypothetical protein
MHKLKPTGPQHTLFLHPNLKMANISTEVGPPSLPHTTTMWGSDGQTVFIFLKFIMIYINC